MIQKTGISLILNDSMKKALLKRLFTLFVEMSVQNVVFMGLMIRYTMIIRRKALSQSSCCSCRERGSKYPELKTEDAMKTN